MESAIKILEQEIEWHQKNKGTTPMSEDWEDGFVKGCEHCYMVLIRAQETVRPSTESKQYDRTFCNYAK